MSDRKFKDSLNPAQKEAVEAPPRPLIVQAGPGTGKTRVLTCRIVHMLQKEILNDGRILAITFTNKAAAEVEERVRESLHGHINPNQVQIATFHGWALGFLREHYGDDARDVAAETDARGILAEALKEAGKKADVRNVMRLISKAKEHFPPLIPEESPELETYLSLYASALKKYGMWDFDDLIIEAAALLEKPHVVAEFRQKVTALLVDEFQDVSPAQYTLLKLMTGQSGNITVIGDRNQAIYGFRGSSPEFINKFCEDFEDVRQITLTEAYRCPQTLLDAARAVIGKRQAPKLASARGRGAEIVFKPHRNPGAEARWIAIEIEKCVGGLSFDSLNAGRAGGNELRSLADVAVLFRTRRIGDMIAQALFEEGIPYQLSALPDPLEQEELKNICRLWEAVKGRAKEFHLSRLPGRRERWVKRGNTLRSAASRLSGSELLKEIIRALEIDMELPEVAGLMNAIEKKPDVESLTLLLREEVEIIRHRTEAVSLLSLHASKGLEFPIVFIAGCDDEIIPWRGSPISEETRLFYVGLTRASERLYITYPRKRTVNGVQRSRRPSRFIQRIPKELKRTPETAKRNIRRPMKRLQKSLF